MANTLPPLPPLNPLGPASTCKEGQPLHQRLMRAAAPPQLGLHAPRAPQSTREAAANPPKQKPKRIPSATERRALDGWLQTTARRA